ncbi:MAG TPA: hypothetical protein PKC65_00245 [Pyrinomonadaceae bacterium]|nr:hypothetical protein [Pyrinomonadaceae bacterium]
MLNRLRISLVLVGLAIVFVSVAYVYSLWAAERQRAADVPVEATSMMIRDLLAFHKRRGSFPSDLKQLESVMWEKKKIGREFSNGDRGFIHLNYFYLYTRLDPHGYSLWAVPMGQARDEAATMFVTGSPEVYRRWKGAALSLESVSSIKADPSEIELGVLGLVEQPKIVTGSRTK